MTSTAAGIPEALTGGWKRVSISLGGEPPSEDMDVWWLQTATRHADLRVPHGIADPCAEQCLSFAGTTSWDEPWLTWTPELTLLASEEIDTGRVSWDGEDMLEAGSTTIDGSEVGYVERWRRIPSTSRPHAALSTSYGRLVRTGSRAISIVDARPSGGSYQAVAWRWAGGAWTVDHAWPQGAAAPAPPLTISGPTVRLADGLDWTVDEVTPDHD
jgi:hypothetical protein